MENMQPRIPLLGEDGRRPKLNLMSVYRFAGEHVKDQIHQEAYPSLSNYKLLGVINRGPTTYVLKAEEPNGDEVALKRVQFYSEGQLTSAFMEIKILRALNHKNIIKLENIIFDRLDRYYLCWEYSQENLIEMLKHIPSLDHMEVKCLMKMLTDGVAYMHGEHVMHRNISASHVLIYPSGMLKLAGFGKAIISSGREQDLIYELGVPGYRAPELILEHHDYKFSIDVWSVGCIFAELLLHRSLFPHVGSDIQQMNVIIELCGSPTDDDIPNFSSNFMMRFHLLRNQTHSNFERRFTGVPDTAIDLLKKFLAYDPSTRIKADVVQNHPYFSMEPLACPPEELKFHLDKKRITGAMVNYREIEEGEVISNSD